MSKHHTISLTPTGQERKRLVKRYRKERRFRAFGVSAIAIAFMFLSVLLTAIVARGSGAFVETSIRLPITFSEQTLGITAPITPEAIMAADFDGAVKEALKLRFPEAGDDRLLRNQLYGLVSKNAGFVAGQALKERPELLGTTAELWLPASTDIDLLAKGTVDTNLPPEMRRVSDTQLGWYSQLKTEGRTKKRFNTTFFSEGDSREPEQAGILGAFLGSIFTIAVCMALALPVGVITAVYLEEFAPQNKFTDIIEVNINNLAAVPSIVFGLLGLAVYLHFFGLPRSSSLVGGLTLALMILPTLIIATRSSLKSVPPSIRQAAMGVGASPIQVILHHVLPLAMPGIMTGTILGIARALGETAPLLMIGMVAFVADIPSNTSSPATVMPVQIFLWSDSPEAGFQEKTAAAIVVLLAILIVANAGAAWLRKKYERKW